VSEELGFENALGNRRAIDGATPYFIRINSASISARGMTGMRRSRARATSGLA
jgi:hypothetical protein